MSWCAHYQGPHTAHWVELSHHLGFISHLRFSSCARHDNNLLWTSTKLLEIGIITFTPSLFLSIELLVRRGPSHLLQRPSLNSPTKYTVLPNFRLFSLTLQGYMVILYEGIALRNADCSPILLHTQKTKSILYAEGGGWIKESHRRRRDACFEVCWYGSLYFCYSFQTAAGWGRLYYILSFELFSGATNITVA